jgi:hypothetical protein
MNVKRKQKQRLGNDFSSHRDFLGTLAPNPPSKKRFSGAGSVKHKSHPSFTGM